MDKAQLGSLSARGVDFLDVTDKSNFIVPLKIDQALAFAGTSVTLTTGSRITVVDSGTNLSDLDAPKIVALRNKGFAGLDGIADPWSLSADEFTAMDTMLLGSGGVVTLSDEGGKIGGLNIQAVHDKGIDVLDASDNKLTLTKGQYDALGGIAGGNVALTACDTVTLADASDVIGRMDFVAAAAKGIDILDVTDASHVLTLSASNARDYLGTALTLGANDTVAIVDTPARSVA